MRNGDLTYDDFLNRLTIQDILLDAGYQLNRRDGLRYPAYIRRDSNGSRIRGDKFVVTSNGNCCFLPPEQKLYNLISFIRTFPHLFREYQPGMAPDHLVNLVCNRLLNHPVEERNSRITEPKRDFKPFSLNDYDIHRFNPQDRETQKKFYPYFKFRGIDLYTQYTFHRDFFLATKHRTDGLSFTNLAFPLSLPKEPGKIIGLEERGRPRLDGSSSYKGKAEGSNSSEGLWIGNLHGNSLKNATGVAWFESAYDALAFYQLNREAIKSHPKEARNSVYVSTGGTPTEAQIRGMLAETPDIMHYLCFDNDAAGHSFVEKFKQMAHNMKIPEERIRVFPMLPCYKDWNDVLLERVNPDYLEQIKDCVLPVSAVNRQEDTNDKEQSTTLHR